MYETFLSISSLEVQKLLLFLVASLVFYSIFLSFIGFRLYVILNAYGSA